MNMMIKALATAVLALAATTGVQAAGLSVGATPGSTVVGGLAVATISVDIQGSYTLGGGLMDLSFDASQLELQAGASSLAGIRFSDLGAWADAAEAQLGGLGLVTFNPGWATGSVVLSAVALPANVPLNDVSLPIILSFKGLAVGDFQVGYALEVQDELSNPTPFSGSVNIHVSAVPEPASYAMMLAGVLAVGAAAARRRKA